MALGKNIKKAPKNSEKDETEKKTAQKGVRSKKAVEAKAATISKIKPTPNKSIDQEKKVLNKAKLKDVNENVAGGIDIDEESEMLIVFPVANEEYAMSIDMVKEVVTKPPVALIPQAPKHIMGAANVRGNVLAVVDLAQRVGIKNENPLETSKDSSYVVVVKSEEYSMAIAVAKVPDTITVKKSKIDRSNDILMHSNLQETYIEGVIKIDGRMIILIDIIDMLAETVEQ